MMHPKLPELRATLDDARTLLVEIVESSLGTSPKLDLNYLDAARQFTNSALEYVKLADDTQEKP